MEHGGVAHRMPGFAEDCLRDAGVAGDNRDCAPAEKCRMSRYCGPWHKLQMVETRRSLSRVIKTCYKIGVRWCFSVMVT